MSNLDDRTSERSPLGEEDIRFIRNFNDLFLSIGLGLFIFGLGIISTLVGGQMISAVLAGGIISEGRNAIWTGAFIAGADAVIVWMLGEVFARTRRLFLPAIVILVGFLFYFVTFVGLAYVAFFDLEQLGSFDDAKFEGRLYMLVLAAAGAIGSLLYYARMKLPFAMGLFGISLAGCVIGFVALGSPGLVTQNLYQVIFLSGVFLFALGVFFDARDPERLTRLSDNGFWLHFFAAPLIFFSVMEMAGTSGGGVAGATMTLVLIGVFTVISLLINRRALLVAGLLSAMWATGVLVTSAGLENAWSAAVTLLILGGAITLLGAGWHVIRGVLIAPFPKTGPIARIIPPETRD